MNAPWKVVLAFVGVFVAGAIFGGVFALGASGKRPARPHEAPPPMAQNEPSRRGHTPSAASTRPMGGQLAMALLRSITQRISLTPEQREKIEPIAVRAAEDLRRLQRENLADTARVTERMHADVAAILSPEQRAELEGLKKQLQQRLRNARERAGENMTTTAPRRSQAADP